MSESSEATTTSEHLALGLFDRVAGTLENLFEQLSPYPATRAVLAVILLFCLAWAIGFSVVQVWRLIFTLPVFRNAGGVVGRLRGATKSASQQLDELQEQVKKSKKTLEKIEETLASILMQMKDDRSTRDPQTGAQKSDSETSEK